MIVCLCEGVNDRVLREAVRDGACSVGAIARRTRAGTCCGACACDLKRVVKDELAKLDRDFLQLAAK